MTIFERYQSAGVVPPPCHLTAKRPRPILLSDDTGRAFSLTDPPKGTVREVVKGLDVEHSARYRPTSQQTQCNVYAHDLCHAAGAYLPRVWWKEEFLARQLAFAKSLAEKASDPSVALRTIVDAEITRGWRLVPFEASYGLTCAEIRANELLSWLRTWGALYGWREHFDPGEVADNCDEGGFSGVICARNRDPRRSGHITVVLGLDPEGLVLQSQAGRINRELFIGSPHDSTVNWWESSSFADFGFFAAPIPREVSP